ncbi:MAG: acyl-CoA thioesterase [Methanobacteriota archaeon]|nr:MAG: acyl-CoA thioesterase [Euryarchaeota archaeon]
MNNWPIVTEIPVLWGDMDDFGHVNNIIYLKWCETSRVELFRKVWDLKSLKMEDILSEEGMGPILANFNMNYRIPVQYPDLITVKTRVTSIGNTSFGISHELYSKANGENIVANAESVVVMINYKLGEKIAIDEDNRSKLKQFFGGPDRI